MISMCDLLRLISGLWAWQEGVPHNESNATLQTLIQRMGVLSLPRLFVGGKELCQLS